MALLTVVNVRRRFNGLRSGRLSLKNSTNLDIIFLCSEQSYIPMILHNDTYTDPPKFFISENYFLF